VSLAGPDGRIIGGEVDRVFVAAAPVKVIIHRFSSVNYQKMANKIINYILTPTKTSN
jgi:hypothetical protein